ncbi:hypothetical protein Ddye_012839 [Dipteronia dyeriana]|uniref:Protein FAR1-RELATED SEQUENCE n=1 Tax=Dipteronia dyeriana TaxID=168575 RepID=A0AAD9X516_9ROSI|nr:hypothetical protein Ddye_012839 [Dipteronia dyeriana]
MPFAAFVGVNHHEQSTLFGCGLISNEDTETYIWLFQSWPMCMSSCAPTSIIFDLDKAMQKTIEIVFPDARHRWCLWHILKMLPEKIESFKNYEDIKSRVLNIVYESLTRDEFEDRWNELINMYGLHANEWLLRLYDERGSWVPAFLKDTFWAGLSTTQRNAAKAFERLESYRFAQVDVPPNYDHDGNILATQESIVIESNSQIQ